MSKPAPSKRRSPGAPPRRTAAPDADAYRLRGMDCLCGNVRMAARALTAVYDDFLAPSGLTASQLAVLWCVLGREPVGMGEVSEVLVMDKTTVSRNMARLLELGFVACRAGSDARTKLVSCSAKGRKAFASAVPRWKAAQAWVQGKMGRASFAKTVVQAKYIAQAVTQPAAGR